MALKLQYHIARLWICDIFMYNILSQCNWQMINYITFRSNILQPNCWFIATKGQKMSTQLLQRSWLWLLSLMSKVLDQWVSCFSLIWMFQLQNERMPVVWQWDCFLYSCSMPIFISFSVLQFYSPIYKKVTPLNWYFPSPFTQLIYPILIFVLMISCHESDGSAITINTIRMWMTEEMRPPSDG